MFYKKKNAELLSFLSDLYIYEFFNARLKFGKFSSKDFKT